MLKETIIKKQKGKDVIYTLVTKPKKKLMKYPPIYSYTTRGKTKYKCFSIREEGLNTKASADTVEELFKKIDKIIFEHRNGIRLVVSRDSNPTVEEYFAKWVEDIYDFDRTRKQTKSRFNTKVAPYIGHYKLRSLTPERLFRAFQKMYKDNEKYKSNQHIIVWTSTLKQMLDHAIEAKLIHENYMNNSVYKPYKKNNWFEQTGTINQYEPEEINIMLKGFEQVSKLDYNQQLMVTYIMVLLFTGLRRSETTGLRWKDICLEGDSINVNGQWLNNARQERLKTVSSIRVVPILGKLKKQLCFWKDFQEKTVDEVTLETYIFLDYYNIDYRYVQGDPRNSRRISDNEFKKFLKAVKLPYKNGLHCFRHTCGSYLASIGIDAYVIRDILGHSDVRLTEKVYISAFNDDKQKAMQKFDEVLKNQGV